MNYRNLNTEFHSAKLILIPFHTTHFNLINHENHTVILGMNKNVKALKYLKFGTNHVKRRLTGHEHFKPKIIMELCNGIFGSFNLPFFHNYVTRPLPGPLQPIQ